MDWSQVEWSIITQNPSVTNKDLHGTEGLTDNDVDNDREEDNNE